MSPFIIAAIWAPFSFFLHNVIHELAHGLMAMRYGGRILELWPFPSKRLGYFTWAYVKYSELTDSKGLSKVLIAPLIAEGIWLLMSWVLVATTSSWIQAIFVVEMIAALIDSLVWLLGWWNPKPNPYSDAERLRTLLGYSVFKARVLSLNYIFPLFISVCLVLVRVLHLSTGNWD